MLPEVQKLLDDLDAAWLARETAINTANDRRDNEDDETYSHEQAITDRTTARNAHRVAEDKAWGELIHSDNKLVRYIGKTHFRYNRGETKDVLKALPLDYTGLMALADERGWCGDFQDAMDNALEAGVIDGVTPRTIAERRLDRYLRSTTARLHGSDITRIKELVDDIVKRTLADHGISEG